MRQCRVAWLHRSWVYHRSYGPAKCGVTLFTERYRAMEGLESQARRLGLRRCRSCKWPSTATT